MSIDIVKQIEEQLKNDQGISILDFEESIEKRLCEACSIYEEEYRTRNLPDGVLLFGLENYMDYEEECYYWDLMELNHLYNDCFENPVELAQEMSQQEEYTNSLF